MRAGAVRRRYGRFSLTGFQPLSGVVRLNSESVAGAHQDSEGDAWSEYQPWGSSWRNHHRRSVAARCQRPHGRQGLRAPGKKEPGCFRKYTETPIVA